MKYLPTLFALLALVLAACGNTTPPPAQPKIARVEVSPTALLLTKAGESQTLSAKVFDDQGKELTSTVVWSSSNPAAANVDASGKVTAISNLGSAQITASAGGVKGSIIAVMAQPVAGAVLVSDAQIVGEPQAVNANAAFGVGFRYRITLQSTTPPSPGTVLLSSGEKPVAGKVVSVSGNDVILEVVPIDAVFAQLNINETINLAEAPLVTPAAIAQNFDTQRLPDGRIRLIQKAGGVLSSQGVSSQAEFGAGPFQCKTEGNLVQIQLAKSELAFTPNLKLETIWNNTQKKIVVKGQPTVSLEVTPILSASLNAKVTCKLTLAELQVPFPGPVGIFLGAVIPIGAGFELEGKAPVAQVGAKFKTEVGADFEMGFACNAVSCGKVESLKRILSGDATPIVPSLQANRIEASFYAFFFADLEAGARLASLSKFRIGAIESAAGLKLEAKLASEETQAGDAAYASTYKLAFEAVIGAGDEFEAFLKMLKVTVAKLELKLTQDIAFSPSATATADKSAFREGEVVKFKVKLDPSKAEFPIVGYNINAVRIYRKERPQGGGVVLVLAAQANASGKQTEFDLTWAATLNGEVKDNFVVFVESRLLPDLRLELGNVGVSGSCTAPVGVKYCVTDLSSPDDLQSLAEGINDAGQVVGTSRLSDRGRGFLWQNGQITFLTEPKRSNAIDINSSGQVVGFQVEIINGLGRNRAFLWQGGSATDLGVQDGTSAEAHGINDSGQVVGKWNTLPATSSFLYQNGQMTALTGLGRNSLALDINNKGQVVGQHEVSALNLQGFLWDNGRATNLGNLPGQTSSLAFSLNENAQVVGRSGDGSRNRAFIWQNRTMTELPGLSDQNTEALDINNAGQVVGMSSTLALGGRAVLWQGGTVTDLNAAIDPALGWRLRSANAINNRGQIVGFGTFAGKQRAFLLTPVQP